MYDWRGKFIDYDDPPDPPPLRDAKGHFLPHRAAGLLAYRFEQETYFDEEWGCERSHTVPVYQYVPAGRQVPEGWQWDEVYFHCAICGEVLAKEE